MNVDSMNFGGALRAMKDGYCVARRGWNGRDMWVAWWKPGTYEVESGLFENCPALQQLANKAKSRSLDVGGCVVMRTADGSIVFGWLASQTDMFAEDWELRPAPGL